MATLLGLDMTLRNTGWSIWEHRQGIWHPTHAGLIRTKNERKKRKIQYSMQENIRAATHVMNALQEVIDDHMPVAIACELLGGTMTASSARTFGLIEGVFSAILRDNELPWFPVLAIDAKEHLTGDRKATKEKMVRKLEEVHPAVCTEFFPKGKAVEGKLGVYADYVEHIADSLAVVMCAMADPQVAGMLKMATRS